MKVSCVLFALLATRKEKSNKIALFNLQMQNLARSLHDTDVVTADSQEITVVFAQNALDVEGLHENVFNTETHAAGSVPTCLLTRL